MAENTNILLTVQAWADILEDIWLDKIDKLDIRYSNMLEYSFIHEVMTNASGDPSRVEFAFNYYGKFVDMGVGKGVKLSDVKELSTERRLEGRGTGNRRHPKKWYGRTFYAEIKRLTELLAQKYARKGSITIIENLEDNALRWKEINI